MSKDWNLNLKLFKIALGLSVMFLSSCGKVKNSSSGDATTYGSNVAGSTTFKAANAVLSTHCFSCHGGWSSYGEQDYVTNALVIASDPANSPLYTRTRGNDSGTGRDDMPLGRPDLSFDEVKALKDWILSM
mgnify:CR=1 FL=1